MVFAGTLDRGSSWFSFPIRGVFAVLQPASQGVGERMVPKGHPAGRSSGSFVEVLVLAALWLHRQDDQVPFFPVHLLAVDDSVTFAVQDE